MNLKERLRSGETVVGCFQRVPSPDVTELCAFAGFDFVVGDMEHTPVSEESTAALVRAAEATGIDPLVRVPGAEPGPIARLLEAGVVGLHVPRVASVEATRKIVRATRHHPRGERGLAAPRATGYGTRGSLEDYVRTAEDSQVLVCQVESRAAIEQAEEIAAVDGVDVVFVGLTDLSQDLGRPGDYADPEVARLAAEAIAAVRGQGKAAGVPVSDAAFARTYVDLGATYLATNDVRLFLAGAGAFLADLGRGR